MRLLLAPLLLVVAAAFRMAVPRAGMVRKASGVRSMTAVFDALTGRYPDHTRYLCILNCDAGLAVANLLNSNSPVISSSSMPVAVVETKQGMYKEYTVEREDDSRVRFKYLEWKLISLAS